MTTQTVPTRRAAEAQAQHGADGRDAAASARAGEPGAGGEVGRLGAVEECRDLVLTLPSG